MDHLALVTNFFDACPYFHADCSSSSCPKAPASESGRYKIDLRLPLLVAVDDPSAGQVVGRKLDRDLVSRENADEILAHLAGNMRQPLGLVFQFNAEHPVRQRLHPPRPHSTFLLLPISVSPFPRLFK